MNFGFNLLLEIEFPMNPCLDLTPVLGALRARPYWQAFGKNITGECNDALRMVPKWQRETQKALRASKRVQRVGLQAPGWVHLKLQLALKHSKLTISSDLRLAFALNRGQDLGSYWQPQQAVERACQPGRETCGPALTNYSQYAALQLNESW